MKNNTYHGEYEVKNKEKYIGSKNPLYRSSWESRLCFFFFDNNPKVLRWGY